MSSCSPRKAVVLHVLADQPSSSRVLYHVASKYLRKVPSIWKHHFPPGSCNISVMKSITSSRLAICANHFCISGSRLSHLSISSETFNLLLDHLVTRSLCVSCQRKLLGFLINKNHLSYLSSQRRDKAIDPGLSEEFDHEASRFGEA